MKYLAWHTEEILHALSGDECHVWLWKLPRDPSVENYGVTLSSSESAAADRFIFPLDRAKYVLCHSVVRFILGLYTHCSPALIEMETGSFGKPVLTNKMSGIHFSLSHTSSHAILAVGPSPVGADIEQVRPIEPLIAEMHFSLREQRQLAQYQGDCWNRCFFRCWTRKEAILKAEGTGLNVSLASFDVEVADDKEPSLVSHHHDAGLTCAWRLFDISPSHKVVAALATQPEVTELKRFWFDVDHLAEIFRPKTLSEPADSNPYQASRQEFDSNSPAG